MQQNKPEPLVCSYDPMIPNAMQVKRTIEAAFSARSARRLIRCLVTQVPVFPDTVAQTYEP
jgi:hypothetical protein